MLRTALLLAALWCRDGLGRSGPKDLSNPNSLSDPLLTDWWRLYAGGGGDGMGGFSDPFDLFSSIFGASAGGGFGGMGGMGARDVNRPIAGEDDKFDLQVEFLEAVFGTERQIEIDRMAECKVRCGGLACAYRQEPPGCLCCLCFQAPC